MKQSLIIFLFAGVLTIQNLVAQSPSAFSPGANAQRLNQEIEEQRRLKQISALQKDSELEKTTQKEQPTPGMPELSKENEAKNIPIKEISFSPSAILPQSCFDEIKSKYEGGKISVNDIFRIVNDLNNAYLLQGAASAKAYLAPQDISQGKLYISLVEGRTRHVNVTGNDSTSADYVRRAIGLEPYALVDLNDIQRKILKFNAGNDAKARVALEPGPVYGTSDLTVTLNEPQRFTGSVFTDNAGQEETGLYRAGLYLMGRSLLGVRDILSLGGVMSEGTYSAFGSYEVPEPNTNTRLGFGFDYSETEIVDGALEFLDITGDYHDFYVYAKNPVYVTENNITTLTLTLTTKDGSNYISDLQTQNNRTKEATFACDNVALFGGGYLYNSLGVTYGDNKSPQKSEFFRINYMGEYHQRLAEDFFLNVKFRGQYGKFKDGRVLPSSEQMQIGGVNTIRGYREGMLIANSAISESVELQYEFASLIDRQEMIPSCKLFAFFDAGTIYPNSSASLPSGYTRTIYSTGAGIRATLFGFLETQLVFAKALKKHQYFDDEGESFLFLVKATF